MFEDLTRFRTCHLGLLSIIYRNKTDQNTGALLRGEVQHRGTRQGLQGVTCMRVSAWDRSGPVVQPGHAAPLADAPLRRPVFVDRPMRGERVGGFRMLCGTCVLQALSAVGLLVSLAWVLGMV
jgi:hypothetical protein